MSALPQRIAARVCESGGCLLWTGCTAGRGYGVLSWCGKQSYAHRVVYEHAYGPIPNGTFVCHRCDNAACVNPEHLFLGAARDNSRDMVAKGRQARGTRNGQAKCTPKDVLHAVELRKAGATYASVAVALSVSVEQARRIVRGDHWAHLGHGVDTPRMRAGSRLTAEQVQAAVEAHASRVSFAEIGRRLGVSRTHAKRVVDRGAAEVRIAGGLVRMPTRHQSWRRAR